MSEPITYPLERDGRVVWACCESSIGGPCGHRSGMTDGEGFLVLAEHTPAAARIARPVQLALTPAPDGYGTPTLDC